MVETVRPSVPLANSSNRSPNSHLSGAALDLPRRQVAAQRLAALAHVGDLGARLGRPVERHLLDLVVRDRDAEAGPERPDLLFVHLLLLVGDVLALAALAEAVALDRAGEDDGRLALVLGRRLVGVEHLLGIVAADAHLLQLVVGEVLDHLQQPRVGAEELLADVGARHHRVLLVLAVDDLAGALAQQALVIAREQLVPLAAPQHLDDVPAGAAEHRLELLDDAAVAADRAVEALQVAVDDEDQVVELLARRERDGAERLGLVGLAVAEERPHLLIGARLEAAILQVAREARLVDRHDRAEAHRHRRRFPEVGHQPRVRVRRQAAAGLQLAAEVLELLRREPAFEERARVHARRGVALEVDEVAALLVALALEEVVEAHLVERRRRGEGRDVAADAVARHGWP